MPVHRAVGRSAHCSRGIVQTPGATALPTITSPCTRLRPVALVVRNQDHRFNFLPQSSEISNKL